MKLTVIGCYGAYPPAGEATSGYLVEEGDTKVLLDCGSGVLTRLQEYIPLGELDAVVVSHDHPDHVADLGCLQYAAMIEKQIGRRKKPFSAWGPGDAGKLAYEQYCEGRSYEKEHPFRIGSLRFEVIRTLHEVPCYAVRVGAPGGAELVYSGDTAYFGELANFARDAGCFLCEASFYGDGREPRTAQHLTAVEAGRLAAAARAKSLVLTHLPHFGRPQRLAEEARSVYAGKVLLARRGLTLSL